MCENQQPNNPYECYIFSKPRKQKQQGKVQKIDTAKKQQKIMFNLLDQIQQSSNYYNNYSNNNNKQEKQLEIYHHGKIWYQNNGNNSQWQGNFHLNHQSEAMKEIGLNLQTWQEVDHIPELSKQQSRIPTKKKKPYHKKQQKKQHQDQLTKKQLKLSAQNINLIVTFNDKVSPKYLQVKLMLRYNNHLSSYVVKIQQNKLNQDLTILFDNNINLIYKKLINSQFYLDISSKQLVFTVQQNTAQQKTHDKKKHQLKLNLSLKLQPIPIIQSNILQSNNINGQFKSNSINYHQIKQQYNQNGKQLSNNILQKTLVIKSQMLQQMINNEIIDNQLNGKNNTQSQIQIYEQNYRIKDKVKKHEQNNQNNGNEQHKKYEQLIHRISQHQHRIQQLTLQLSNIKQKVPLPKTPQQSISQLNPVLIKQHIKMINQAKKLIQRMTSIQLNMITSQNHYDCSNKISGLKQNNQQLSNELQKYNTKMLTVQNYLVYDLKNQLDYLHNELKKQNSWISQTIKNDSSYKILQKSMDKNKKNYANYQNQINYYQQQYSAHQCGQDIVKFSEENSFGPITRQLPAIYKKDQDKDWQSYPCIYYPEQDKQHHQQQQQQQQISQQQMIHKARISQQLEQQQKVKKKKKVKNSHNHNHPHHNQLSQQRNNSDNQQNLDIFANYQPWKNKIKPSNHQHKKKAIMAQLFPQAQQKIQFVPPKILKKNSMGFEIRGKNIRYRSINVWGQLVGDRISVENPEQNIFYYKFMKTKYTNANIGIGIVDLTTQLNPQLMYATCIFYLGGGAQVWVGDPKKSRFVKTPGTAFKEGDVVTMTVDLGKGEIAWFINQKQNMKLPHRMLQDESYQWATYLLMMNSDDEIQIL